MDGFLRRREEEIGVNVINLVKRPPLSVVQIDTPTCDSVQRNPKLAI